MYGRETRMLLNHCLEQGVSMAALSRRFGISSLAVSAVAALAAQGGSLQGKHRCSASRVSSVVRVAGFRREWGRGLSEWLEPRA